MSTTKLSKRSKNSTAGPDDSSTRRPVHVQTDQIATPAPDMREALDRAAMTEIERLLRRLHSELRAFLAALPVHAQNASGLARYLSVERTTCQRAVAAVNRPFAGASLASELPGPEGLRLLTSAAGAKRNGATRELESAIAKLRRDIDDFEGLIRRHGPTRSRFLKRLGGVAGDAHAPAGLTEDRALAARKALFDSAAALTGRFSQTWLAAHIYEPDRSDATKVQQTRAHGLLGHVARADAVPLTFHVFAPVERDVAPDRPVARTFSPLVHDADPETPAGVLRAFSTQPLPAVRAKQPDEFIVQAVDPAADSVDLLFGMQGEMPHPLTTQRRFEEVWALVNFPVRRLVLDVFLHRDLARRCLPDLDQHLWGPDFGAAIGERWQTRFPRSPRLQWLGPGTTQAATDAHARHVELLEFLFTSRGQDPQKFIGFRCDVAYPIWRTGYRIALDYGDGDAEQR